MSTKVGASNKKKGAQKHQNTTGWKAVNKWTRDTHKQKIIQGITVTNCCERCTGVIEWKIQYGKYKPLSQPAKCVKCFEKRVKSAYQTICIPCVQKLDVCAKCGEGEKEIVNESVPQEVKDQFFHPKVEKDIKSLPERKRRAFRRQLEKLEDEAVTDADLAEVRKAALEKLADWKEKFGRDENGGFDFDDDDLSDFDDEEDEE